MDRGQHVDVCSDGCTAHAQSQPVAGGGVSARRLAILPRGDRHTVAPPAAGEASRENVSLPPFRDVVRPVGSRVTSLVSITSAPRAASRLATSAAAPPAAATGPLGSGRSTSARDSTSSPISRKIRPRRLVVAHHRLRPPSCGSESARASPTVTPITGRPAASARPCASARPPRIPIKPGPHGDRYNVTVRGAKAGVAQTVPDHDRQHRRVASLQVPLIARDHHPVDDQGRRTSGNG